MHIYKLIYYICVSINLKRKKMTNLLDLIDQAEMGFRDDNNTIRFCLSTNCFSETQALRSIGATRRELNQNNLIDSWCFDDETIHISITNENLLSLGIHSENLEIM